MASTSTSSISGLASGIQWQDMIDQIISLETKRQLTPVTDKTTKIKTSQTAWSSYRPLLTAVRDASKALADGSAFDKFNVTTGFSPSGTSLVSATAGSGAVPGSYKMEVLATASAEKLGSYVVGDTGAAMNLSGTFLVGGKPVTVDAADSLAVIRDKINAANSGTSPSHVSASILTVSSGVNRLILTNESTGSAGIELTENGGSSVLSGLGLVSSNLVANTTPGGTSRSYGMTSTSATIAQALGVPMPSPSTFKVNGQTISVDLSQDSLSSIVAKINAALGAGTANVATETVNGASVSRILVNGSVTADAGDAANSTAVLQQLGFLRNDRTGEAQVLRGAAALTDSSTGLAATAATKLTDAGAGVGDTLTFSGTRTDGSSVSVQIVVDESTTMQDILDALNAPGTGFGVNGRSAAASIDAQGRLALTDGKVGDSKLTLSVANDRAGGGTLDFGATTVAATGRAMQLATAADAQIRIDGVLVTRSANTISDALAGVTLTLQHAEVGTTVDVSVARDNDAVAAAINSLVAAYNKAADYVKTTTSSNGPLALDNSMRSTLAGLKSALIGSVAGSTNGTYTTAALVGLTFDKTGRLQLDQSMLNAALASKPAEVTSLFKTTGTSPLGAVQYMTATTSTKPGTYAVNVTQAATVPVATSSAIATYGNAAAANQMLVTDSFSGRTTTIALADGDTAASIVSKLNTAFGADGLRLAATVDGSAVKISGSNFGSSVSFTVAFQLDGAAASQQLGFGAAAVAGSDVAGTINGKPATGVGQLLTADAPSDDQTNDAQGLAILFTGTSPATSSISYVKGIGGALTAASEPFLTAGSGMLDITNTSLQSRIDGLNAKQTDIQARLDRQRAALAAQFTAMESAMSKLQTQGSWLSSQINSLNSLNSGR